LRLRATLVFAVSTMLLMFGASSATTPLYRIYQQNWGISASTVTLIFAVYALGFLAAILTVGKLSEYVGRRPVVFVSLILEVLAMWALSVAHGPHELIAARVLQGIATGTASSTLGAVILDTTTLHGALINSLAPLLGTAFGALSTSVLVVYGPSPTRLVFELLLVCFVVLTMCVAGLAETATARPGALRSLRPHINVPIRARAAFLAVAPVNVAVWALGGFYLSLMPSLLRLSTGSTSGMIGGGVAALLAASGAVGVLLLHRQPAARIFQVGTSALILGVFITLAGVPLRSLALLTIGTTIAGTGFGAGFYGGLRSIMPLAEPGERAGLLAAVLMQCYLAFSLPTIVIGLCIPYLGLALASYVYGGSIVILAIVSLLLSAATNRRALGAIP
jgi:hypothetical protein